MSWTDREILALRLAYADVKTQLLADLLGRPASQIYQKARALGLKKSAAFYASSASGRTGDGRGLHTRFTKGITPWNKGTHFTAGGRSGETRFKPGHRGGRAAERYQPIGTERISKDGYLERKVNDGMPLQKRWRAVHLLVWEAAHGPLPPGHAVSFKDGNKQNTALENLELVSRADLMRRNTLHNYPKEIATLIQLRGAINRKLNRVKRDSHE